MNSIESIALAMVEKGKGILAADESNSTMTKRLDSVKIPSTEENRLNFREALFTSRKIKDFISGIILFDESLMSFHYYGAALVFFGVYLARKIVR